MKKLFITDSLHVDIPPDSYFSQKIETEEEIKDFIEVAERSGFSIVPAVKNRKNRVPIKYITGKNCVFNPYAETSLNPHMILSVFPSKNNGYEVYILRGVNK